MMMNMMGTELPPIGAYVFSGLCDDSDTSDEEPRPEDLATTWEDLPILERLGLNSCEEMTEEEVESAFFQFAMAFRCDQYTLPQRLQAEEHDRAVAEENLQMELKHTRDTLQMLKARCENSEAVDILAKMETCLGSLSSAMDDVSTAAEMLGAAHQEARVSHAVELMAVHVDQLKRRHTLDAIELLETRRKLQRTRGRLFSDTDDADVRIVRQSSQQHCARRRVSVTLIPNLSQLSDLEARFSEAVKGGGEDKDNSSPRPDRGSSHVDSPDSSFPPRLRRPPLLPQGSTQSQEDSSESSVVMSPPPTLRLRRRSTLVEQSMVGSSDEAEASREVSREGSREASEQASEVSPPHTSEPSCSHPVEQQQQPRPLPLWLRTSRFIINVLSLSAIFCVVFLWVLLLMLKAQLT